jgi:hypothetical protein
MMAELWRIDIDLEQLSDEEAYGFESMVARGFAVPASALLIEDGMTFVQILDAVQMLGYLCASRPVATTTMMPGRFHVGTKLMELASEITDFRAAVGEG